MRRTLSVCAAAALVFALASAGASAQTPKPTPGSLPSEMPAKFEPVTKSWDYDRRVVDIPMRDGVKLHTVILVPKTATKGGAGLLLTRTPYDAEALTSHVTSEHLGPMLYGYDNATDVIVEDGYIRVFQDVRGKYGSEGDYVMNRPLRGAAQPHRTWTTRPTPGTRSTGSSRTSRSRTGGSARSGSPTTASCRSCRSSSHIPRSSAPCR